MNCSCKNNLNQFCYMCGHVVLPQRRAEITGFVKKTYLAYFGFKIEHHLKSFAPQICCKICVETCGIGVMRNGRVCHLLPQ